MYCAFNKDINKDKDIIENLISNFTQSAINMLNVDLIVTPLPHLFFSCCEMSSQSMTAKGAEGAVEEYRSEPADGAEECAVEKFS